MTFKKFVSQNGWFSLSLPVNWEEYDAEEENTYAFFNASSWTGNLRITPLRLTEPVDPAKIEEFIEDELSNNEGATRVMLGNLDCAFYKKDFLQDGEDDLLIYYWVGGKNENIFICSFTISKKEEGTKQNSIELKIVEDIIRSI
jgi:hypothetical protein